MRKRWAWYENLLVALEKQYLKLTKVNIDVFVAAVTCR